MDKVLGNLYAASDPEDPTVLVVCNPGCEGCSMTREEFLALVAHGNKFFGPEVVMTVLNGRWFCNVCNLFTSSDVGAAIDHCIKEHQL